MDRALRTMGADLLDLFFPALCSSCHGKLLDGERHLCTSCRVALPRTGYHAMPDNPVEKRFWGRVEVERAASFLFFEKGMGVQRMLRDLKYGGIEGVGEVLGRLYARDLADSDFARVDAVTAVPLHRRRERRRGYNQSHGFGQALAHGLGAAWRPDLLRRTAHLASQTGRGREDRWTHLQAAFGPGSDHLEPNQTILLVDDVVTTGATLEACAHVLLATPGTCVLVATIACAD